MTDFATDTTNISELTKDELKKGFAGCNGTGITLTSNNINAVIKMLFDGLSDIDLDQANLSISEDGSQIVLTNEDKTTSKLEISDVAPALIDSLCPNVTERVADETAATLFCDKEGIGKSDFLYKSVSALLIKVENLESEVTKLSGSKLSGFTLKGVQRTNNDENNSGWHYEVSEIVGEHITVRTTSEITTPIIFTLPSWITSQSDVTIKCLGIDGITLNPDGITVDVQSKELLILRSLSDNSILPFSKIFINYKSE